MNSQLQRAISDCRDAGQRVYAGWDDKLFQRLCSGPVEYFWEKTDHDLPGSEAYLSALAEGMGRGYITQSADPRNYHVYSTYIKWQSLLEFWLVLRVPLEFPQFKPALRPATLAKVWNLGENILRDKPWIDPYLLKLSVESPAGLLDVERQFSVWLEPVLKPGVSAKWEPPFIVQIIDGRTIRDDFIPGEMHLSTPSLVCIRDRRLPDFFGGVFLHDGNQRVIAHHRDLGASTAEPQVDVEVGESQVKIKGHAVQLPNLGRIHSRLMSANGVAVFTAVDSQRIWLVRSQ
jgi:hypothetical protein